MLCEKRGWIEKRREGSLLIIRNRERARPSQTASHHKALYMHVQTPSTLRDQNGNTRGGSQSSKRGQAPKMETPHHLKTEHEKRAGKKTGKPVLVGTGRSGGSDKVGR